jgi:hypothetical protein
MRAVSVQLDLSADRVQRESAGRSTISYNVPHRQLVPFARYTHSSARTQTLTVDPSLWVACDGSHPGPIGGCD